jgi:glycosyltransferase involved in cell wall biosynthesis
MSSIENRKPAVLAIVVPCYNEEEVLPETIKRLRALLAEMLDEELIDSGSSVWFVDDGSKDSTWELIASFATSSNCINGIKLSRNKGHQHALLAGLETASGDVLISIDADLQDDISVIKEMMREYHCGKDVVYGVRKARKLDTPFKRITAEGYYYFLQKMGVNVVFNHADFRLMSRRSIEALRRYEEVNLFLRGIIPSIGFPSSTVVYDRAERFAGESKYPLRKMLALAVDGVTSFSALPLRMIAGMGLAIFALSMLISIWALWTKLFTSAAIPGWASSVLPMYLLGGIQLLSVGVLGEYVAKIYMESKRRPRYIVQEILQCSAVDGLGVQKVVSSIRVL